MIKALEMLNHMFNEENFRSMRPQINEAIAELEALIKLEEDYKQALDKLKDGHVTRLGVGEYNIHMINNGGKNK